jgi:hypothetical protein
VVDGKAVVKQIAGGSDWDVPDGSWVLCGELRPDNPRQAPSSVHAEVPAVPMTLNNGGHDTRQRWP